jgi:hypothetical protein
MGRVLAGLLKNATLGGQPGVQGLDSSRVDENRPAVFLGYVVTKQGSEHELYRTLTEAAQMKDIDYRDWDR